MSRPARSSSLMTTASASSNFSRNRTSSMQVSSGLPHMLASNQRGRGQEPVTVLGRTRSRVTVNGMALGYAIEIGLPDGARSAKAGTWERQIPSSKLQIPTHLQQPNPNRNAKRVGRWIGAWDLGVRWDLELGAWDLTP